MFHHFHSESHSPRPGSISADDFDNMLDFIESRFRIVEPGEFVRDIEHSSQSAGSVVLTFDDALLSQIDVAAPILRTRGYTAVFSVYSSVFSGHPDPLEIFASFREEAFPDFLSFWSQFQCVALGDIVSESDWVRFGFSSDYLSEFPFYSREEKKFRFARDEILGRERYFDVMWSLVERDPFFDLEGLKSRLWMDASHLSELVAEGHAVGLHSHSHPTRIDEMPKDVQALEYQQNYDWISGNLGVEPNFVAHPCGRYSDETLEILRALGVTAGFCSSMRGGWSSLEVPREDHANILREMRAL